MKQYHFLLPGCTEPIHGPHLLRPVGHLVARGGDVRAGSGVPGTLPLHAGAVCHILFHLDAGTDCLCCCRVDDVVTSAYGALFVCTRDGAPS